VWCGAGVCSAVRQVCSVHTHNNIYTLTYRGGVRGDKAEEGGEAGMYEKIVVVRGECVEFTRT